MKAFLKKFGEPLEYPEFFWPGFLTLLLGLTTGALPLVLGFKIPAWDLLLLPIVMIVCGILLLRKTIVGSVLLTGLWAYWIYSKDWKIGPFLEIDWLALLLDAFLCVSLGASILYQFIFHYRRRAGMRDLVLRPPDHTL
ncbi:hypothetical protein OKA04_02025 [Luteolibacter flavescens]|uniref:DUF4118 domain-containing protein n=1 Tax=Luteolibacter flavescens TaxID=1859460 RepID=A0ABT3FIU7_9BACT|nr:hypothetical protein [Luteolibacter flavescens]MCW1883486.1 hypothetical protein [Luteolibacter flavescens]